MNTAKEKRTELVTGGSRGLGRAMALELAAAGAHGLSTTSTDEMRLNRLAQQSGRVAVMLGRFRQMFAMKAKSRAWCRR